MSKKHLITLILAVITFFGFVLGTSPYELPLPLIIVPGIAFSIIVWTLSYYLFSKLPFTKQQQRLARLLVTSVTVIVVALMSVGQLTLRDFLLLVALAAICVFYISRMWSEG